MNEEQVTAQLQTFNVEAKLKWGTTWTTDQIAFLAYNITNELNWYLSPADLDTAWKECTRDLTGFGPKPGAFIAALTTVVHRNQRYGATTKPAALPGEKTYTLREWLDTQGVNKMEDTTHFKAGQADQVRRMGRR